ncbi:MAG: periplasmic heavy metal sensor [Vicinamibacterales bacterium]
MTTQSRTLLTIAAAAVVVTTTIAATAAGQSPVGRGPGGGPGRGGPGGPMPVLRQLNLTDAQREQIKTLTDAERAARTQSGGQAPARTLFELQQSLQAAIFADTPDTAQIDQLKANIAEAEAAALAGRIDLQVKIAQILTPEQRAQARELTAQRANRAGRAGRLHGPKPGASGQ